MTRIGNARPTDLHMICIHTITGRRRGRHCGCCRFWFGFWFRLRIRCWFRICTFEITDIVVAVIAACRITRLEAVIIRDAIQYTVALVIICTGSRRILDLDTVCGIDCGATVQQVVRGIRDTGPVYSDSARVDTIRCIGYWRNQQSIRRTIYRRAFIGICLRQITAQVSMKIQLRTRTQCGVGLQGNNQRAALARIEIRQVPLGVALIRRWVRAHKADVRVIRGG